MSEVLHANIFFVIASVATVVFIVLVSIILFHVLKIVRSVRAIVERIEEGSDMIVEDVAHARSWVIENVIARVFGMVQRRKARTTRKRARDDGDDANDVSNEV